MNNFLNQPEYILKQSRLGMLIININEFYILNGAVLIIIIYNIRWENLTFLLNLNSYEIGFLWLNTVVINNYNSSK